MARPNHPPGGPGSTPKSVELRKEAPVKTVLARILGAPRRSATGASVQTGKKKSDGDYRSSDPVGMSSMLCQSVAEVATSTTT